MTQVAVLTARTTTTAARVSLGVLLPGELAHSDTGHQSCALRLELLPLVVINHVDCSSLTSRRPHPQSEWARATVSSAGYLESSTS